MNKRVYLQTYGCPPKISRSLRELKIYAGGTAHTPGAYE